MHAAAPPPNQDPNKDNSHNDDGTGSVLGLVPHQLRGFLAQFRNMHIVGAAYDKCTGCSETVCQISLSPLCVPGILTLSFPQVLQAYEKDGFEMMLNAFTDQKYLPALTGLDKLYDEGEAALESVDWDEEDEDADL